MKTIIDNDTIYYIGRNAQDNWDLFDKMNDEFYWFHLNDFSGCHVYIESDNPSMSQITRALELTKEYSKIPYCQKVSICYTQKKFLKKGRDIGSVIINTIPKILKY